MIQIDPDQLDQRSDQYCKIEIDLDQDQINTVKLKLIQIKIGSMLKNWSWSRSMSDQCQKNWSDLDLEKLIFDPKIDINKDQRSI